jgi:hypothetical protein
MNSHVFPLSSWLPRLCIIIITAFENVGGVLNERVVSKLAYDPPAAYLVQTYLQRICEQFEVDWAPAIKLSVDQMIQPMAPPVGYSVSVAQGSGLGPVNIQEATTEATTGQANADEEINYQKQNGGFPSALPVAQAYVPPQARASGGPSSNVPSGDFSGDFEEVDIYVPRTPTSAPAAQGKSEHDNDEEIYIPQAPTAPAQGRSDHDNDDESGGVAPGGGNGSTSAAYDDLAARFNALKK